MSTAPSKPEAEKRIPSLDGLRAVSILFVVFGHAFGHMPLPWLPSFVGAIVFNAALGVQIFFVLSGFLITGILLGEKARTGSVDIRRFYIRRFFRIIPASYLYLSTLAILTAAGILAVSWNLLLESFLYVLNYHVLIGGPMNDYWYVGHFWTLCMEQQFYLVWPLLLSRLSISQSQRFLLCVVLLLPLVRMASYYLFPEARGQLGIMFHSGSDSIFIGSLTAVWLHRFPEWRARLGQLHWAIAFGFGLFLFALTPYLSAMFGSLWNLPFARTASGVVAALLLIWSIENGNSLWGKFLNLQPMVYIGAISYGLYLWQQLFLGNGATRSPASMLLGIAAAFAVAALSFHLFERPILSFGRRITNPRPDKTV